MDRATELRARILELVGEYHEAMSTPEAFVAGTSHIPYGGRVVGRGELTNLVDASLDLWLTAGRFARRFEAEFAAQVGVRHALLVNSGSSANLLAVSALCSPKLGDRRLRPGDEVITVACGFPTTIAPIVQNGLVPVFVDIDVPTYNIDVTQLEAALSPRTRAVVLAHTLGNPFDLDAVTAFVRAHDLWLVEDCCDALGATWHGRQVGTFGDLATASFYAAHHMTMGEGGTTLTDDDGLRAIVRSLRDWGRDCWCDTGEDDRCGCRFAQQHGELPFGFDHKYVYTHLGYNLKVTDMQAAVGLAQLEKLPGFNRARARAFDRLSAALTGVDELILPRATPGSEPSWFCFPLAVAPDAGFTRDAAVAHLEAAGIATRMLLAGNLVRQPAMRDVVHRSVGDLPQTDVAMNDVFIVGLYPGLSDEQLDFIADTLRAMPSRLRAATR
ncbi:MAG TPA: lipopolysaccharide biosynthesis protein RfbH [Baekduia sp.]|jgi:CDP-6-deoxy-D-xylo-4-hexulose-3-dehydrase